MSNAEGIDQLTKYEPSYLGLQPDNFNELFDLIDNYSSNSLFNMIDPEHLKKVEILAPSLLTHKALSKTISSIKPKKCNIRYFKLIEYMASEINIYYRDKRDTYYRWYNPYDKKLLSYFSIL